MFVTENIAGQLQMAVLSFGYIAGVFGTNLLHPSHYTDGQWLRPLGQAGDSSLKRCAQPIERELGEIIADFTFG